MTKRCSRCQELKDLSEFNKDRSKALGIRSYCKLCQSSSNARWRQNNPEYNWAVANPGRMKVLRDRWNDEHKGELVTYHREWRADNPQRAREQYRKAAHKRRLREDGQFIEVIDSQLVYEMHGGMCGICHQFIDLSVTSFDVDHIYPISKGGLHCYANVQPAHPRCNRIKKDRIGFEIDQEEALVNLAKD